MSAEAASRWALAKEALVLAEQAHAEISAGLQAAQHAEREAWEELEKLSGRKQQLVTNGGYVRVPPVIYQGNGGVDVVAGKIA